MKVLQFKGKMPLKNKILTVLAIIIIVVIVIIITEYIFNEKAREWINIYILKKEITEDDVATIQIDADKVQHIYAYDKYIAILSNGKLEIYNNYAYKVSDIEIQISNPIFETKGMYLVIAEKDGQKIYLINERKSTLG